MVWNDTWMTRGFSKKFRVGVCLEMSRPVPSIVSVKVLTIFPFVDHFICLKIMRLYRRICWWSRKKGLYFYWRCALSLMENLGSSLLALSTFCWLDSGCLSWIMLTLQILLGHGIVWGWLFLWACSCNVLHITCM